MSWHLRIPVDRLTGLRPGLSLAGRLAFVALHAFVDPEGLGAFPSRKTLGAIAGLSLRGVSYALRELESAGLIRATPQPGRASVYEITGSGPDPTPARLAGDPCTPCKTPLQHVQDTPARLAPDQTKDQIKDQKEKRASRGRPSRPPAAEAAEGQLETLLASLNGARAQVEAALEACASTRKSGRMSTGRALATLEGLLKHGSEVAAQACRTFVERHYSAEGKGEAYLHGIARSLAREALAKEKAKSKREGLVPWA